LAWSILDRYIPFYLYSLDFNSCEFKKRFLKENGDPLVAYVISVKDYETLAIDMAEIMRYLDQQKQIIIYYEKALKPKPREGLKK